MTKLLLLSVTATYNIRRIFGVRMCTPKLFRPILCGTVNPVLNENLDGKESYLWQETSTDSRIYNLTSSTCTIRNLPAAEKNWPPAVLFYAEFTVFL